MAGQQNFEIERYELQRQWTSMSASQKEAAWERFTLEIDEGAAGWNRYRPILWPAYENGVDILSGILN